MNVFRLSWRKARSLVLMFAGVLLLYFASMTAYKFIYTKRKVTEDTKTGSIPAVLKFGDPDVNGQVQVVVSFEVKDLAKAWDIQMKRAANSRKTVNLKGMPPEIHVIMENTALCDGLDDLKWIVYIKTSPDAQEKRQLLRDTWADIRLFRKNLFRVIFLIGQTSDITTEKKVKEEFQVYRDIVQGDFIDSERNATLKAIMGLKWVKEHCSTARYAIKANDYTFINIFEMMKLMDDYEEKNKERIMICPLWKDDTMPILRDPKECGLWCVKDDELPGRTHFPQYCAGVGFIISREIVKDLYNGSRSTPFFWIDDVYITGLVPKTLTKEIHYVDILSRFTMKEELILEQYTKDSNSVSIWIALIANGESFTKIWRATIRRLQPNQFKLLSDSAIARHM